MTKPRVRREEALVKSVHVMDTSRRVGWGKFYAEAEKVDDLSRDLNMARSDFDLMSRFAGYLYGAMTVAAPKVISDLPAEVDRLGILTMLPQASMNSGRRASRPRGRSQRKSVDDDDVVRMASELILDRREKLSDPNCRKALDLTIGPTYRVDDRGDSRATTASASAWGGVTITHSKGDGGEPLYLTPRERKRLLKILQAIELAQDAATSRRK